MRWRTINTDSGRGLGRPARMAGRRPRIPLVLVLADSWRITLSASTSGPPTAPWPTSTCSASQRRAGPKSELSRSRSWWHRAKSANGSCCPRFCTCPVRTILPAGAGLAVGRRPSLRRRRVRPQPRRHASPAGSSPRPSPGCAMPASIARAPLLPWSAPPDVPRISPVEASTRYLRHLVEAWNHDDGQRSAGRPPGEAGRRPHGAGVVRRHGPHPDRRGGAARRGWKTSRCWRSRRPRSTAGWRRTPPQEAARSSRAITAWSSTSAAAPATSA